MDNNINNNNNDIMTLAEIAKYLKVSEKTILRMANKGGIPGTKVSNQWRFMRAMVDDWLIGKMQSVSKKNLVKLIKTAKKIIPISDIINSERIILNIRTGSKKAILEQLIRPLVLQGQISNPKNFLEKLLKREEMISTAIGHGVALPHFRDSDNNNKIKNACMVLGICKEGTDFDALDAEKVYVFILICAPSVEVHLRLMAKISLLIRKKGTVDSLRKAKNTAETLEILMKTDQEIRNINRESMKKQL